MKSATIKSFILLIAGIFYTNIGYAQFTKIDNPLNGAQPFAQLSGAAAWGDYDADGDLDLVINGRDANFTNRISIYSNNGDGTFTLADSDSIAGTQLIPLNDGGVAWGDFDNDGDLDLVITGFEQVPPDQPTPRRTLLYEYTLGGFNLVGNPVDGTNSFIGSNRFDPTWVDYDSDGLLDLYIGGTISTGFTIFDNSILYSNNGNGTFSIDSTLIDGTTPFEGYSEGAAAWGDISGNGYPDLLSEGANGFQGLNSTLYENNGNATFSLLLRGRSSSLLSRPGGRLGDVRMVDFDNDGDLDIYLSGEANGGSFVAGFFANEGNNQFTFVANIQGGFRGFTGHIGGGVSWGDFDGDGDSDIAYGGFASGGRFTRIDQNVGNNDFDLLLNPIDGNSDFPGLSGGEIRFGDYDNDGDLDLLVHGVPSASGAPSTVLYQNTTNHTNAKPLAPSNLSVIRTPHGVSFFWDTATDDVTPSEGLNYNIRIGSTPGGSDILAPMSIIGGQNDGKRLIPARGMIQSTSTHMNLPNGTYYWSVQAIDPGHQGSVFATEAMLVVEEYEPNPPSEFSLLYPADEEDTLTVAPAWFSWQRAEDDIDDPDSLVYIFELSSDMSFSTKIDSATIKGDTTFTTSEDLGVGIYYWRVSVTNSFELKTWGSGSDVNPFNFTIGESVSNEENILSHPTSFELKQNFPNPFNPSTTISFDVSQGSFVSLKVYDILGQEITTLVNERLGAGSKTISFDASGLASGIYIYRLVADGFVQTRKMILLK